MKAQLYDTGDRLEYVEKRIEKSSLSESNIDDLLQMKLELLAGGLSEHRVSTVLSQFVSLQDLIDFELEDADREDLLQLARKINQDEVNERDHSVWTLCEYKKALKAYYSWKTGEEHPDCLGFMRVHPSESSKPKIDPDELLDTRMAEKIINKASNPRDKAFLALLWDSGARISEILNLEWKDLVFKDELLAVNFREGKNGPRKIYLVECKPLIRNWKIWKEDHTELEPEDPVFTKYRPYSSTEVFTYRNARKQVSDIVSRTDIPDRIKTNPHSWRKARATDMASKGMTQPNMNAYFGWVPGSSASRYYIRLAARDLEKQVRDMYPGIRELPDEGPQYLGENIPEYDQTDLRPYLE